ncbi:NUDIX hydrolase [Stygiolobus caldivivus]|uniref:DNA mismatch repair protein MutT n=1 Tax=Stygiolobus caldivivus TaxID=2824673 RepID=A0A8D5U582_9CREN|nr:NUDIX hydrolase [Stygiolobus caldivivus]BCU69498.1 DNA mismatch repair protein MutT [Stygiolobus caldivivus]
MSFPKVAVGCVILDSSKRVLLVKRKHPPNQGSWAIPGGKVSYGELIDEALKREMREELSINVIPKDLVGVVEIIKEGFHYVILDFLCEIGSGKIMAGSDAEEAKFFNFDELKHLPISPTTVNMLERYFKGEKLPLRIVER